LRRASPEGYVINSPTDPHPDQQQTLAEIIANPQWPKERKTPGRQVRWPDSEVTLSFESIGFLWENWCFLVDCVWLSGIVFVHQLARIENNVLFAIHVKLSGGEHCALP
jgi:hypothetical protein